MDEYNEILKAHMRSPHFYDNQGKNTNLLYQYRSFEHFMAILKSDSFWATNARFSNDEEEQRFAAEILQKPLNLSGIHIKREMINENYIVCFSAGADKLSQWRGYAPDGGVSVGFDLSGPAQFYVVPADVKVPVNPVIDNVQRLYVQAEPVTYLPARDLLQDESEYYRACFETIRLVLGGGQLTKEDITAFENDIAHKVPYIKHAGFVEEDEWRLVFPNDEGQLNKCIRYRENTGVVKIPYIVVCPGDPYGQTKSCVVRVSIQDKDKASALIARIRNEISDLRVENCLDVSTSLFDDFCSGCTRRRWMDYIYVDAPCRYVHSIGTKDEYQLGIDGAINNVIVSQGKDQEKIFDAVYRYVQETVNNGESEGKNRVKVWCEGHLPIRRIIIGPRSNQSNTVEYVEHFCRHTYWLRDVEVESSKIPYRKSLG